MFNSPLLEVAIGMIFFYLLLSLICSALNEMIEAVLKNRSHDLESGIRRLLDDPDPHARGFLIRGFRQIHVSLRRMLGASPRAWVIMPKTTGLASRLYAHPLIRGLYLNNAYLPSYIPARNFALALLDLVAPGQHGAAGTTRPSPQTPNTVIYNGAPPSAPYPREALTGLRTSIADPENVPSSNVRDALLALIDAADDDPVTLRENIENWFNNTTDRIAGWYKRRTLIMILTIGTTLATVLNADSVLVLTTLWRDAALRSSVASQAEQFAMEEQIAPGKNATERLKRIQLAGRQLTTLGLPIGWDAQDQAHTLPGSLFEQPRQSFSWTLYQLDLHWLGWIITGLAISLGAPFWFDLLNKFVVIRSTVKPKEKSQVEDSKD